MTPPAESNSEEDAYAEIHYAVFAALSQLAPSIVRDIQEKINAWLGRSVTEEQIKTIIGTAGEDVARSLCGWKHFDNGVFKRPYFGNAVSWQNFSLASSTIENGVPDPVPTNLSFDVPLKSVSVVADEPDEGPHKLEEEDRAEQQEILEEEKNPVIEGHETSDSNIEESPKKVPVPKPVGEETVVPDAKTEEDTTVSAAPVARISNESLSYSEPSRFSVSNYGDSECERASETEENYMATEEGRTERQKEVEKIRMDAGDQQSPKFPPQLPNVASSSATPRHEYLRQYCFGSPVTKNADRVSSEEESSPEKPIQFRGDQLSSGISSPFGGVVLHNHFREEPPASAPVEVSAKPETANVSNAIIPSTLPKSSNTYERAISTTSNATNATFDVEEESSYLRSNSHLSELVPSLIESSSSDHLVVSEVSVSSIVTRAAEIVDLQRPKKLLAPHRYSIALKSTAPSTAVPRERIEEKRPQAVAVKREPLAMVGDEPLPWSPAFVDSFEAYGAYKVRITQATDPSDFHVAIYEPGTRYDVEGKLKHWWKSAKKTEFIIKVEDVVEKMPVGIVRSPSVVVRGIVVSMVTEQKTVEVSLIDYGTAEVVPVTKLVRLPKKMMSGNNSVALAVHCRVEIDTNKHTADGRPLWPDQVIKSMKKAVEERRGYQAYFYEVKEGKYVVNLYIPRHGTDETKSLLTHVKKYLSLWDSEHESPTTTGSVSSIFGASTTCASELEMSVDSDGTLEPQHVTSDSVSTIDEVDLDIENVN